MHSISRPAPRIPRTYLSDEGEPVGPHVEMVVALAGTAVTILWIWGAYELVRWVWSKFAS